MSGELIPVFCRILALVQKVKFHRLGSSLHVADLAGIKDPRKWGKRNFGWPPDYRLLTTPFFRRSKKSTGLDSSVPPRRNRARVHNSLRPSAKWLRPWDLRSWQTHTRGQDCSGGRYFLATFVCMISKITWQRSPSASLVRRTNLNSEVGRRFYLLNEVFR